MEIILELRVEDIDEIKGLKKNKFSINKAFVGIDVELDGMNMGIINGGIVFQLCRDKSVRTGSIALHHQQILAIGHGVQIGTLIQLQRVDSASTDVKCEELLVQLTVTKRPNECTPMKASDLKKEFKATYVGQAMAIGQNVLMKHAGLVFFCRIAKIVEDGGAKVNLNKGSIHKRTVIKLVATNYQTRQIIKVSSQELINFDSLKSDLLELEIGGLAPQVRQILDGVFTSQVLSRRSLVAMKKVKGLLLYGPPGTGKTVLASNLHKILTTNEPKVITGFMSRKDLWIEFRHAIKDHCLHGQRSNLHIFIFDHIDSIPRVMNRNNCSGKLRKMVDDLLKLIDLLDNILVIGITDRQDLVNNEFLRYGRLDLHVHIGTPNRSSMLEILEVHLNRLQDAYELDASVNPFTIASLLDGKQNGDYIEALVRRAIICSVGSLGFEGISQIQPGEVKVSIKHFRQALEELS